MSVNNSGKTSKKLRIAIDAMGGDYGPSVIISALSSVLKGRPDVEFIVFGDEKEINKYLSKCSHLSQNTKVVHTDKKVRNDEKPSAALRASKGTSMREAIEAVKNNEADAIVSAGNTGALMALAKLVFKTVPGIHRPAIASVFPGINGDTIMLDLGANLLVDSDNLVQFAVLGSIFAKAHKKIEKPTVGLLNIGSEDMKGPDHIRSASEVLSKVQFPGEYKGFVEGNDITKGCVDVIVCDGYAGNIALKTAEGTGKMVRHFITESFTSNLLAKLGAALAYFSLKSLKKKMDPRAYNGGVFLGLNGLCIKSHGGADAYAFSSAVILAVRLVRLGYIKQVAKDIAHVTDQASYISEEE